MAKTSTAPVTAKPKSALSASSAASAATSAASSALAGANGAYAASSGGAGNALAGSENALKLQNLKGIHEDDGGAAERAADEKLPLDALAMRRVLASMGAERHDPRVVSQLQEFVHRA